jgi:type IV pilus assembly protein PilX
MKNQIMINKMNISTMKDLGRQAGAVLVTSLFILIILTLLAISSMTTSNFELIMATNVQDQTVALANAESAATEGEAMILAKYEGGIFKTILPSASTSHDIGIYEYDKVTGKSDGLGTDNGNPTKFNWDGANGYATGPSGNKYIVEYLGALASSGGSLGQGGKKQKPRYLYRLTGRGTSGRGAERMVQTLFVMN